MTPNKKIKNKSEENTHAVARDSYGNKHDFWVLLTTKKKKRFS